MHPVIAATISCLLNDKGKVVWSSAADQLNGSKSGQWVTVTDACFISAVDRPSKPLMNVGRQAGLLVVDVPGQILQVIDRHVLCVRQDESQFSCTHLGCASLASCAAIAVINGFH